jgi:hypothetical protein
VAQRVVEQVPQNLIHAVRVQAHLPGLGKVGGQVHTVGDESVPGSLGRADSDLDGVGEE